MPPVSIPYARSQPFDNDAYVRAMSELMLQRNQAAAAATLARGQNSQQMWTGLGRMTMAAMGQIGDQHDEARKLAAAERQKAIDNAMREKEFAERKADREADIKWRQQQYETEQSRYRDTIGDREANQILPNTPTPPEAMGSILGTAAARRFRTLPGQPAAPAWEAPAEGDAMADAGPATPAVPMAYMRNPNAQEQIALRSAALAEQDRVARAREFTISQGAEEARAQQAKALADRNYNRGVYEFDTTNQRLRDKDAADNAPFGGYRLAGGSTGDALLAQLPEGQAALVKSIANYTADIAKVSSTRGNERQKLAQLVLQYDPSFDMNQYPSRSALAKDFRSGKASTNIRSLNTAVGHLDSFAKAASELNNSSWQTLNRVSNWWNGETGDPRISKVLTAANAIEGELAAVFKGTAGTDQEIKEWRRNFNAASSPEQFKAVVDSAIELMGSRLQALQYQYETGMAKPKNFNILSPKSREIIQKLGVDPDTMEPPVEDPNKTTIPKETVFDRIRNATPAPVAPGMFGPRPPMFGLPPGSGGQ